MVIVQVDAVPTHDLCQRSDQVRVRDESGVTPIAPPDETATMTLDIVLGLNQPIDFTLPVVINSAVQNSRQRETLRFNIVVPTGQTEHFQALLETTFPSPQFQWRLGTFQPSADLADYLAHKYSRDRGERLLGRFMQFSRVWLPQVFPDLTRILYFDTDVVLLEDPAILDQQAGDFNDQIFFAAVPHSRPAWLYFKKPWRAHSYIKAMGTTFNSGVMVTDLRFWTEAVYQRIQAALDRDRQFRYRFLEPGDEALLNACFPNYRALPKRWNRCGYGNARFVARLLACDPQEAAIIHWSGGHHKPWNTHDIIYGDLWRRYANLPDRKSVV